MMLEKADFRTIATKLAGFLFLILIITLLPPPSLSFLFPLLGAATVSVVSLIFALRTRNAVSYLIYYLASTGLWFLLGLRFWDISIGLSWALLVSLVPGILLASLFPFTNRNASEFLYREQVAPRTRIGRLFLMVTLGVAPVIGVIGAVIGSTVVLQRGSLVLSVAGLVAYGFTLGMTHSGFHMYTSGRFEHWLEKSGRPRR